MTLGCDQFNSSIFEIPMANVIIENENYTEEDIKNLLVRAKDDGYRFLSVKLETNKRTATNLFLKEGFSFADTLITYRIPLKPYSQKRDGGFLRLFVEKDKEQIMEIAKTSFVLDQFHGNAMLPSEKSDRYYEQWAKNLCEGLADRVYVIDEDGYAIGFMAVKYEKENVRDVLAAIGSQYRGKGYYTRLLEELCMIHGCEGFEIMYNGTQLTNLAALRAMGKVGGEPIDSKYVLHKML